MRLGLGTVQFGLDYGISNARGRIPEEEVQDILASAASRKIRVLDTASAYGQSEAVLGRNLPVDDSFRIVTKTPVLDGVASPGQMVQDAFKLSLERLGQESLYCLNVHHARDLLGPCGDEIYGTAQALKDAGLIERVGVSVYTAADIDSVLSRYRIDLVQVPLNILDQRLAQSGDLQRMKAQGIEVHLRSVFLQGLLLMNPDTLQEYFDPIRPALKRLHRKLRSRGLTPVQGALAYARSLQDVDVVLIGVNSLEQLETNIVDFEVDAQGMDFTEFANNDPRFVNPSNWRMAGTCDE